MLPTTRIACCLRKTIVRRAALLCGLATLVLCGCGSGVQEVASSSESAPPVAVPQGPQLGYGWKADDQSLRPFLGILGSAQIGQSVVPAAAYVAAGSSAISSLALLIGADGHVYMMSLPSGTPVQTSVTAAAGSIVRFSPSGVNALLFVPGAQSAVLLTSLTSSPQAKQILAGGPLLDAASSDAGTVAALVLTAGGASVNRLTGTPQQLATLSGGGSLAFVGTGDSLLAADASANALSLIRSVSSAPSAAPVPTAGLLKSPVAVGAALNGRWAVVANGADSSVVRLDLSGAVAPQRVASVAQPTVVQQLSGNGVFRFTDVTSTTPVWVGDMTTPNPSLMFIPALAPAGNAGPHP
jgi:hypothetical protein